MFFATELLLDKLIATKLLPSELILYDGLKASLIQFFIINQLVIMKIDR